jgi:ferredoxin/thioredoxin reductase
MMAQDNGQLGAPGVMDDGTVVLAEPVALPDVLDMLVVGGGPAGTAAGFRARELGIAALVIDYDDLMARIRDYAKDKLIYPSYGGGDGMRFPLGDELVAKLHFPPLDKDDLFRTWRQFYADCSVPARVGIELVGLEQADDGIWMARCWNHNVKQEELIRARHVVIGVGRGVPRRLDIPGNVEGLAFRMAEAGMYLGRPVCVMGGGTSAAEAVIEISNAKAAAGDETPVCWSYRGDKMPKVSKALADVFFDAYFGNGNIRYLPQSNPEKVVEGEGGADILQIRSAELGPDGKPLETRLLEFGKGDCIACIGSDVPEKLLDGFGIKMMTGGKANKKRITISPLLESQLPHVYLAGDMLSPVYLETDDFTSDPAGFKEVKRRGNIKAALRDGVFVTEVIAQRLAGKSEIRVQLEFADDPPQDVEQVAEATADAAAAAVAGRGRVAANVTLVRPSSGPGEAPQPAATLVRILPTGVEADEYPVTANAVTTIGRRGCDVSLAEDTALSSRHASISHSREGFYLRDESTSGGVFLQLADDKPVDVETGTILRIGQQWLVCAGDGAGKELVHFNKAGKEMGRYPVDEATIVLGRKAPDVNLDKADLTLSRRHLSATARDGKLTVRDLRSTGGTYIRVAEMTRLELGNQFLVGQQRFLLVPVSEQIVAEDVRVDADEAAAFEASQSSITKAPGREVDAGPGVTFAGLGTTCPFQAGQTICEIAEANGVEIVAECHAGVCGSDPIRIEEGAENLNEMSAEERDALEDICSLEPGSHRLACMARPSGPVSVTLVGE